MVENGETLKNYFTWRVWNLMTNMKRCVLSYHRRATTFKYLSGIGKLRGNMSALDRMERFVKDLSFRRLGMVGGVRKRFARPWQTPKAYNAEFVIEIGDTPYGKKGTWKQEIELGKFPPSALYQVATELIASNPETFGEGVVLRQVMKK
tara:strand:- start:280 stop:726 length:447 start_codon:yes stop_codon:yes gene_type:complete